MHEFGIAERLVSQIEKEVKKRGPLKVKEIRIELGQLLFIEPETLKFIIGEMSRNTPLKNAEIKIKMIKPEIKCPSGHSYKGKFKIFSHHHEFPFEEFKCRKCGKPVKILSGNECKVKEIVFE
ncbi:MAG: hydrogenase maturation nickel metallochaperone HypA [Candidatus Altiarchaeota archaeon]